MSMEGQRYRGEVERGIVTPEAVVLDFDTASVGSRTVAELLDLAVQGLALFLVLFAVGLLAAAGVEVGRTLAIIVTLLLVFLVIVGYPIAFETLWHGRTLGKAAMGLRVVTVEGGPIRLRHAALRGIFGLVELWVFFGSIAVIAILASRRDQRVGDLAAGTLVLRERQAAGRSRSVQAIAFHPPYGYEGYVASLDVSALTADQYGLIRSFLLRVAELSPHARQAMAVRLANPTADAMRHRPPPAVGPELFLVCVASAYQRRHA
jgi:uncharacterized RDD family membrane protein YckC